MKGTDLKNLVRLLFVLVMMLSMPAAAFAAASTEESTDTTEITAAEAARVFRIATGMEQVDGAAISRADVTGNLSVTRADVRAVLMRACGRLHAFSDLSGAIEDTLLGESHIEKFSYTGAVRTDNSYRSENIAIELSSVNFQNSVCYIADIYVRDITSIRSALSNGVFDGRRQSALTMCKDNNGILGITGDMYTMNADGAIVRDGIWYDDDSLTKKKDICVLYRDGTMAIYLKNTITLEQLKASGDIWQMWAFGPALLDEDGEAKYEFNCNSKILGKNPRTAIGYYAPGHYCFVVVDGRQKPYSEGLRMEELSQFMASLGCCMAYNLDGGKSASMVDGEKLINSPSDGGRSLTDIIYLAEPLA